MTEQQNIPANSPANIPANIPAGYEAIFQQGFNAWVGPILGNFAGPDMGPHHFIFDVRPEHLNGGDMLHGGMMMTLADVVLGSTVANAVGGMGSTIALNCDFLAGVKPGTRVEGEATVSRLTRSVAFVSGRLFSGDQTFLTASGIWKISPKAADETSTEFKVGSQVNMNEFAEERALESYMLDDGTTRWKPPRDVAAPDGFTAQHLGDPFEAWVGPFFLRQPNPLDTGNEGAPLEVAFQIDDRHVNANGVCHGGMFLTFADATLGIVPWTIANAPAVTLSLQSQFLRPGHAGDWVITRPRLIRKTPSIIFIESTFEIEGEIVFTTTSLWKVIGK